MSRSSSFASPHVAPAAWCFWSCALGTVAARRLDAASALLPGRSDRARTGVPGRVEGAALRDRVAVRNDAQPVRHRRLQAVGHARAEHQHHRRSAGLELVHEPDRHDRRSRPTSSRAARIAAPPPDPSRWVLIREKTAGRPSGLHGEGRQGRDLVPRVRSRRTSRKARPAAVDDRDEDLLGARLQPGRIVPHDVRSEARRDRPEGHGSPPVRRADAVHAGRHERDPRTRRAQTPTGRIASSPAV